MTFHKHKDDIRIDDGAQSMRDSDGGSVLGEII